ncbi:MAG: glycosyltransferase family 4 protein [Actinomycetota bacterium]|nr:glycosyltransferase family 4 protein [Actinomycetota bacterium]
MVSGARRVLLVVDSLEVGGAERHVVDLALALRRDGYEVEVACSVGGGLSGPLEEEGLPVRALLGERVKRRVSVSYARELGRLARKGRFDLVHAHIYASAAASAAATRGTGVPLVVTEHTEATWQDRRARLVSGSIYRRARYVIAVSGPIRRRLIERDAVPPEKVTVIPNAVIAASGAPTDLSSILPEARRDGPLIGVVARLQPEKGVTKFLRAAARVGAEVPNASFLVVGDGPLRGELSALAERLGLSDRARFLGYRSDARAIVSLLDVLVVPSLTEGAPLTVLEAMASGVPVVASAVGGIPDQVRHGKEGLLVRPGDPGALCDALVELLRDPARARRLGEAGRRRVEREFSHEATVRRVEAVYRGVCEPLEARAPGEPELETVE